MATFDISQLPQLRKHIDDRVRKAAQKGLLSAANRIVGHIKSTVIPNEPRPPVDTGIYAAAWKAQMVYDGAEVFNDAPHAPIIEYGVRAANVKIGRKMIEALASWVKRKGFVADFKYVPEKRQARADFVRVRKEKKTAAETDLAAHRIAWAIAKKMQQRGIFGEKGLRILEKAMRALPDMAQKELAAELEREFG